MNEEIQVGEWIRTIDGYIGKVVEKRKESNTKCEIDSLPNMIFDYERDYIKHSFNLIDLIEAGDYVNGYKVIEPNNDKDCLFDYMRVGTEAVNIGVYKDDIKTIVTKEQFKSMEYRVGGEDG